MMRYSFVPSENLPYVYLLHDANSQRSTAITIMGTHKENMSLLTRVVACLNACEGVDDAVLGDKVSYLL